jgi:hypothetical protein
MVGRWPIRYITIRRRRHYRWRYSSCGSGWDQPPHRWEYLRPGSLGDSRLDGMAGQLCQPCTDGSPWPGKSSRYVVRSRFTVLDHPPILLLPARVARTRRYVPLRLALVTQRLICSPRRSPLSQWRKAWTQNWEHEHNFIGDPRCERYHAPRDLPRNSAFSLGLGVPTIEVFYHIRNRPKSDKRGSTANTALCSVRKRRTWRRHGAIAGYHLKGFGSTSFAWQVPICCPEVQASGSSARGTGASPLIRLFRPFSESRRQSVRVDMYAVARRRSRTSSSRVGLTS